MQQYSSKQHKALAEALAIARNNAPGLNMGAAPHPSNPISGIFGSGQVRFFTKSGNFLVPANCTRLRARGFGVGGKPDAAGATLSFGAHFSITGGAQGPLQVAGVNPNPSYFPEAPGGVATGGDINHSGGAAPASFELSFPILAGGGAASIIGPGDRGGAGSGGRNGFTGHAGKTTVWDASMGNEAIASNGEIGKVESIDFIATGGGGQKAIRLSGTSGTPAGSGSNGGGGGAPDNVSGTYIGGAGGFPGGGQGGLMNNTSTSTWRNGGGGGGFCLKDISGLAPGASIAMTIPDGGLIIVEW